MAGEEIGNGFGDFEERKIIHHDFVFVFFIKLY